jgi:hypothetical protein
MTLNSDVKGSGIPQKKTGVTTIFEGVDIDVDRIGESSNDRKDPLLATNADPDSFV